MYHLLLTLLSAVLLSAFSYGQNLSAVFSNNLEKSGKTISFIGESPSSVYILSNISNYYAIQEFSKKDLAPVSAIAINLPNLKNHGTLAIDNIMMLGGKPTVFYSGCSIDERTYNLYMMQLNDEGVLSEGKLIFSSEEYSVVSNSGVMIKIGADQHTFTVLKSSTDPLKKSVTYTYACISADGSTLIHTSKKFDIKGKRKILNPIGTASDGEGNFIVSFAEILHDKKLKQYITSLHTFHYAAANNYLEESSTSILQKGQTVIEGTILRSPDEWIITGQYYASAKKRLTGVTGVYRFTVGISGENAKLTAMSYSNDVRQKSLRGAEENVTQIPILYQPVSAFCDSSGNTWLVTERQSVNALSSGLYEYYFGSMIVSKMNADGTIGYQSFIAKSQFYRQMGIPLLIPAPMFSLLFFVTVKRETRQYLSHTTLFRDGELYLLFNDNPSNEHRKDNRENLTRPFESLPVMVRIATDGTYQYNMQQGLSDGETIMHFRHSLHSSDFDGLYFLSSTKKGIEKLGMLKLE